MARPCKFWLLAVCIVSALVATVAMALQSRSVRIAIYRVPLGGNFDKYTRLSKLLTLGMSPIQVKAVLGAPDSVETFTNGIRWLYVEEGSTTGCEYTAEFQGRDDASLRLVYERNVEHVLFPTSRRWERGQRLEAPQLPLRH
jgi:outer membrane protein assembly factor BamE (lipoprotein component of BamABCDE complex)